ncbi:MAG: CoA-binding protein, partial [Aliifodinibius sp.]|nr:CoA-binding protein [Fodinibius sp.]
MSKSAQVSIAEFLQEPEFVFIGLSRDPKHFSRSLFKEFLKHGYEPVPVNPNSDEIEGKT